MRLEKHLTRKKGRGRQTKESTKSKLIKKDDLGKKQSRKRSDVFGMQDFDYAQI